MNRTDAMIFLPLIQAYAEGKTIQTLQNASKNEWADLPNPDFNAEPHLYRIKPEPTLRPWKLEEVPVGAVIRRKGTVARSIILGVDDDSVDDEDEDSVAVFIFSTKVQTRRSTSATTLRDSYEWKHATSDAPEAAWFPCGVQVQ